MLKLIRTSGLKAGVISPGVGAADDGYKQRDGGRWSASSAAMGGRMDGSERKGWSVSSWPHTLDLR